MLIQKSQGDEIHRFSAENRIFTAIKIPQQRLFWQRDATGREPVPNLQDEAEIRELIFWIPARMTKIPLNIFKAPCFSKLAEGGSAWAN